MKTKYNIGDTAYTIKIDNIIKEVYIRGIGLLSNGEIMYETNDGSKFEHNLGTKEEMTNLLVIELRAKIESAEQTIEELLKDLL